MQRAVVFGAGNIGRGFIGQLFSESGREIVFVDIDTELVQFLRDEQAYELLAVSNAGEEHHEIGPATAIMATDAAAVAAALDEVELAATAVGVRALDHVVPHLALACERRAANGGGPLNVILCENLKGAAGIVREKIEALLDNTAQDWSRENLGLVDTVIGRMVPPPDPRDRAENVGRIRVEPYKELPVDRGGFKGPIPEIVNMIPADNFAVYTARKLYIHNCGHALLAYAGYQYEYEHGYEALDDPMIRSFLYAGWRESAPGIVARYDADPAWLQEHMADLDRRFRNRALGDTIFRLGRDPGRKLGPTDRLVAPARLAAAAGVFPVSIATAIAMALRFDPEDDPLAKQLQDRLHSEGIGRTLPAVTGIEPDEPLGEFVIDTWEAL